MNSECVAYEPTEPADADEETETALPIEPLDLRHAAKAQVSVLLTGESSEAQVLARRIHELSDRCQARFLAVDCRGPAARIESVLCSALGLDRRPGREEGEPWFRQAGTVLLRDVGRLDRALQRRLADMLVASTRNPHRGARLIASSAEPLDQAVSAGTFDDTLYYRLNAIHLVVGRSVSP